MQIALQTKREFGKININECMCFKAHLYGRCQVCKLWQQGSLFDEVKELIKKYPNEVRKMIYEITNNF